MIGHEKLWSKFLNGDKEALSLIFKSFFDDLYHYGLKITRRTDVIEDSMQDMYLKIWKNRSNLGEITYLKSYLFKSLRRHIINNLEVSSKLVNFKDPPEELFDIEFSHEDFLITEQLNTETRDKLVHALNSLSKRQREAIFLRFVKGFEFETIAEIMAMNVQSVRNSIHRALTALRDIKSEF